MLFFKQVFSITFQLMQIATNTYRNCQHKGWFIKHPNVSEETPPESIIDLSTYQKNLLEHATTKLTTTLDAVPIDNEAVDLVASSDNEALDLKASSDKSETSSELDAK